MYQIINGGTATFPSTSAVNWVQIGGFGNNTSWQTATGGPVQTIAPCAFEIKAFYVEASNAPGTSKSYTYTIYDDNSGTSAQVVISGSNTTGSWTTGGVNVAVGSDLALRVSPSGTPTQAVPTWAIVIDTDSTNKSILGGAFSYGATGYSTVTGLTTGSLAKPIAIVPTSGDLTDLYVQLDAAPGTGNSITVTLYHNESSTSNSVTISGSNTTGSNTANDVSVSAGDDVYMLITYTGLKIGTKTVSWGLLFEPDTDGESIILGHTSDNPSTANSEDIFLNSADGGFVGTFDTSASKIGAAHGGQSTACTFKNLYVELENAPGSSKSYEFILRKNGSDTSVSVTISGTSTTGNDTSNTATMANYDDVQLRATPTSSPSTGEVYWGIVSYIAPSSSSSTSMKINISDVWKTVDSIKINIGDTWKEVDSIKINIGDSWKTVF